MPFIVEVRGHELYPTGGNTPQEEYGENTWGPAIYGPLNRTELTAEQASTFSSEENARNALLTITVAQPNTLEYRIREIT